MKNIEKNQQQAAMRRTNLSISTAAAQREMAKIARAAAVRKTISKNKNG